MHDIVHTSIEFIRHHAIWAGPILFLVSFGESFVGLSLLFPGTTIMVLAGAFVRWPMNPHGVLDPWPLLIGSISGAVLGDAISFWLGLRFGHLIERHWYFQRHPDLLPRGYKFFERYGLASVFIGRFFGPVRAVIPLVAGIMEMPWRTFWFANIGSALIWAPALLFLGSAGLGVITRLLSVPKGWHLTVFATIIVAVMALIWAAHRYGLFGRVTRHFGR